MRLVDNMLAAISTSVRFRSWFPYFGEDLAEISTTTCNATWQAYLLDHLVIDTPTCYRHMDCMLSNLRESTKSHLGASVVILGLTPSIPLFIGPSLSQLTLLSARRPILAFLLMIGSPGLSLDALLRVETPSQALQFSQGDVIVPRLGKSVASIISGLQYLLALGCAANVLHNSFQIGDRTILVWKCNVWYLPLIWSLAPILIYFAVCVPYHFTSVAAFFRAACEEPSVSGAKENRPKWTSFWRLETALSSNQQKCEMSDIPAMSKTVSGLLNLGFALGLIHMIVGTVIFSSLLFISAVDTLPVILRYAVSAAVCRGILAFELGGMKRR
jgi:hypothetical protein